MALILLLVGAVSKVVLVFSTQRLMNRDKKDFVLFWEMAGLTSKVSY